MKKAELRQRMRAVLAKLGAGELEAQSLAVTKHAMQALQASTKPAGVCLFLSKPSSSSGAEVQTRALIDGLLSRNVRVYVPFITGKQSMTMLQLSPNEDIGALPLDKWGIPVLTHVAARNQASAKDIDLVFFPGLAFQLSNGNRLGQGMAFYDIFITALDAERAALGLPRAVRMALALDEMIVDFVPVEEHDVKMDAIITSSYGLVKV